MKKLHIALMGKGSCNHLHRTEIISAFKARGVSIHFIVRSDYLPLLVRLDGCDYSTFEAKEPVGWRARLLHISRQVRNLNPGSDKGRREVFRSLLAKLDSRLRSGLYLSMALAHSRYVTNALVWFEGHLHGQKDIKGLDPGSIEKLLLLGVGTVDSELEGSLTWWGRKNHVPMIHVIGNYDNLSSKGYRGVPVDRLLVWGPNMRQDAEQLHGIPSKAIAEIGSLRYNTNLGLARQDRSEFLESIGLQSDVPTVLFAGFVFAFHYFEMLEVIQRLRAAGTACQLVLRIYPNQALLTSSFMSELLTYARSVPGVYISHADPHHGQGSGNHEVIQIEEIELWSLLKACNVVVNQFSTISLEACMFNKPVINMWYFPDGQHPKIDYSRLYHNRRIVSYGAIEIARSSEELMGCIRSAVAEPGRLHKERAHTVAVECGPLDGLACSRLVETCLQR